MKHITSEVKNVETTTIKATTRTTHSKEDTKTTTATINVNQPTTVYAITAMNLGKLDPTAHYVNWTIKNSKKKALQSN